MERFILFSSGYSLAKGRPCDNLVQQGRSDARSVPESETIGRLASRICVRSGMRRSRSRRLLSVVVSDSFVRANAGPSNLGMADLAYGGSGANYYSPLFPTAGNPANPVGSRT